MLLCTLGYNIYIVECRWQWLGSQRTWLGGKHEHHLAEWFWTLTYLPTVCILFKL